MEGSLPPEGNVKEDGRALLAHQSLSDADEVGIGSYGTSNSVLCMCGHSDYRLSGSVMPL
jgi:hypothetical protein